jgi:hypothetical protein
MAFVEDLSVFFNDGTPGYVLAEIDGVDVGVLFDSPFQEVNFIESSNPIAYVKTADITGVAVNSVVMNGATEYRVIGVEDDGAGVSKLELRLFA